MDGQLDFGADDDRRAAAKFYAGRAREALRGGGRPHESRPCRWCGSTSGVLFEVSGQNSVYCGDCGKHSYNAPKTETGQRPRTVETLRPQIKPSQQARVLDRDHGRCVLCGATERLTIGHLLSLHDAFHLGATEAAVHDDANLAAMCEACNAGLGRHSVSPRTYAVIMWRLVQAEMARRTTERALPPPPVRPRPA